MEWLRPILILAGALFLLLLLWWERRRAARSQAATMAGEASQRRPQPHIDWGATTAPGDDAPPLEARSGEASRPLPQVTLPAVDADDDDAVEEGVQGVARMAGITPAPLPANAAQASPDIRVEWPPAAEQRICALRLMPASGERFAGRSLRLALQACGFRAGPFGILHLPDEAGRALASAANLAKPGTLDPARMDAENYPGLNLFAVLSRRAPERDALERLAAAGRELASRTGGVLVDEASLPVGSMHGWIDRCMAAPADAPPGAEASGPAA